MPLPPRPLQPRLSNMPRPKTEAAAYIDVYKLTVEKQRLLNELESISKRQHQIATRLQAIVAAIEALEARAHGIRQPQRAAKTVPSRYKSQFIDF
ncbi:MAG: gas vesicle protein GvpV [Synechococcaceae cyanobacterium SM2_3_60]|nr:gas vesicle protein GvpV [Synechococcaceae cyanobacterium SM2_3_60]